MAAGEGFQTSARVYQAAFARLEPGLGLPPDGVTRLRGAFQAADRKGRPAPEIESAVSRVVGDYVWDWPWFQQSREALAQSGWLPRLWAEEGIGLRTPWEHIPHNKRVMLLTGTIGASVAVTREVSSYAQAQGGLVKLRARLRVGDERCPAMAACVRQHGPRIAAGDLSLLPPFFAGDGCWVEFHR